LDKLVNLEDCRVTKATGVAVMGGKNRQPLSVTDKIGRAEAPWYKFNAGASPVDGGEEGRKL
jgi:hypothetical protein